MGLLDQLKRLLSPPINQIEHYEYVRCNRCGERLAARVNMRNDLSIAYDDSSGRDHYFCRKVVMGSGMCFQKIEIDLIFDTKRNLQDRKISGGKFISRQEYEESLDSD